MVLFGEGFKLHFLCLKILILEVNIPLLLPCTMLPRDGQLSLLVWTLDKPGADVWTHLTHLTCRKPAPRCPYNSLGKLGHIANVKTEDESLKEDVTRRQEKEGLCCHSGRRKILDREGRGVLGWGSSEVRSYFWGLKSSGWVSCR